MEQQRAMDGFAARVRSGAPSAKHGLVLVPSAANRSGEDKGGQQCDALGVCLLDADSVVVLDHDSVSYTHLTLPTILLV